MRHMYHSEVSLCLQRGLQRSQKGLQRSPEVTRKGARGLQQGRQQGRHRSPARLQGVSTLHQRYLKGPFEPVLAVDRVNLTSRSDLDRGSSYWVGFRAPGSRLKAGFGSGSGFSNSIVTQTILSLRFAWDFSVGYMSTVGVPNI